MIIICHIKLLLHYHYYENKIDMIRLESHLPTMTYMSQVLERIGTQCNSS